jgi:hypothetical protein
LSPFILKSSFRASTDSMTTNYEKIIRENLALAYKEGEAKLAAFK